MRKGLLFFAFTVGIITQVISQCMTSPGFGGNQVVESFEGLPAGPNLVNVFNGYRSHAVTSAYTFPSGVTYTNPVPNPGVGSGFLIGDYSIGPANFGLGVNGTLMSGDVPSGSAYFGYDNNGSSPAEFSFSTPMETVGFYFSGLGSGGITFNAYDCSGTLLNTCVAPFVNVSNFATNFIGFSSPVGICRIEIIGSYFVIDNLTFEEPQTLVSEPIPTMGEWGLISLSLLLLICGVSSLKRPDYDLIKQINK